MLDKAFQCVRDESTISESNFKDHLYSMIEMAYAKWMDHAQNDPDAGVDPELLGELEAIMESSPRATCQKTWSNVYVDVYVAIIYIYI